MYFVAVVGFSLIACIFLVILCILMTIIIGFFCIRYNIFINNWNIRKLQRWFHWHYIFFLMVMLPFGYVVRCSSQMCMCHIWALLICFEREKRQSEWIWMCIAYNTCGNYRKILNFWIYFCFCHSQKCMNETCEND